MLFNSTGFLFKFLPVTIAGFALCFLLPPRYRKDASLWWLLIASLLFYSWSNPFYLALLIVSAVTNYLFGKGLLRIREPKTARTIFIAGVAANLCLLGYFKYSHFLTGNLRLLLPALPILPPMALPLGISFYTFTQIVYLTDAYRKAVGGDTLRDYVLFVVFFPHLIAGPIVHHWQLLPQLKEAVQRWRFRDIAIGGTILTLGLAEKILIADTAAQYASPTFNRAAQGFTPLCGEAWIAALAYTMQLYFDFAGYSNMAIGLSYLFGIRLPVNFNSPYRATSVIDFWRRWHITLSQFLRDYVYIPLGGSRRGSVRRYVNLFVTMLVGGLWHGAGWTFIFWGGLHGAYLMVNHGWRAARTHLPFLQRVFAGRFAAISGGILTFAAVVIGWVFFRSADSAAALRMLGAMFAPSLAPPPIATDGGAFDTGGAALIALFIFISIALPNVQEWMADIRPTLEPVENPARRRWRPSLACGIVMGVVFFLIVKTLLVARPSEFLYSYF